MEESLIEDVEEIYTVLAELKISKGKGNLILCVVNSPAYRDKIIQAVRRRFLSKVIPTENGAEIIRILKEHDFDGTDILIWVMPEEPTEDLLNTLNNFRELFYEVKIPNLVFYNQAFSESVIRKAPDFWRYRGNYYEFEEAERGMAFEAIETLVTPFSYQDKEDLQRRKRINEYLLEKVRDKEERAKTLNELGMIFYYLGELDKALEYYKKALKLSEELGIKEGMASALRGIGAVYKNKGELDNALEYFERAFGLYEELGRYLFSIDAGLEDDLNKGIITVELKNIFKTKRSPLSDNAIVTKEKESEWIITNKEKFFVRKEDGELIVYSGITEGMAKQLVNIGAIYSLKGEMNKALENYKKTSELHERLEIQEDVMAAVIGNVGVLYILIGKQDKALESCEKALEVYERLGMKEEIATQLENIGTIYATKGELDKALEYYEKALGIFEDMGIRIETARTLMNIGDVFVHKGDKEQASDYYREANSFAKGSSVFGDISKRLKRLKKEQNAKDIEQNTEGI